VCAYSWQNRNRVDTREAERNISTVAKARRAAHLDLKGRIQQEIDLEGA